VTEPRQAVLAVRRATVDDYPSFAELFPEMRSGDRVPDREVWASTFVPSTWVASRDGQVVGYCYFQEYAQAGYVRNVVVAPLSRQLGVGRALMQATADELRAHGKRSWRLNVMPENRAALALYERMGMREKYKARSFRFSWSALQALPNGNALVRSLTADRDPALEALFELPSGQLAFARNLGRILLEALNGALATPVGLALFDPKFPGAFPFRVTELNAVRPLLEAMRQHVPNDEHVSLVTEDDERLAALLKDVGAILRHEIVHLEGSL